MKYALLAYATTDREHCTSEEKRSVHDPGHYATANADATRLLAHYRCRPSRHATTLRLDEGELLRTVVPTSERQAELRALFIVESDDYEAVIEHARQLPILRLGGAIDIWPLTEPSTGGHQAERSHTSATSSPDL